MELYARVRRAVVVEKMSEREAARQFRAGSRDRTEDAAVLGATRLPGGYRNQRVGPSWTPGLEPSTKFWKTTRRWGRSSVIRPSGSSNGCAMSTATRAATRLWKDYVRWAKEAEGQREMFVPLEHPPGDGAQADFGEAMVVIGGVERKAHYLAVDLPQSDDCFVMAFPAETTEAFFLEGHNYAFAYFGGSPTHDPVRQHQAGGGEDSG